ncbi:MAG: hypothetical protein WC208_09060 [Gallionella sp.]|jgi:hypothetical protein
MKTRLGIFIATLLLLPLAGLLLTGAQWNDLVNASSASDESIAAALRTSMMLLFYVLLVNHTIKRLTGNSPFSAQKSYFIGVSIASMVLCWLLSYLNLFVASWTVQQDNSLIVQILLYTPLFALLAPAVLITRALLGSFPGLLKALTCRIALPAASGETLARILLPLAVFGLLGGAAWPAKLFWLLWVSPLLLLVAMQFLWHESSIFAGGKSGDWGRILCTALSGIAVGNLAVISYQANASLTINLSNTMLAQAGFAVFGLTCLQLGDVIAENWRGKSRTAMFQQKKKFPIPVVVKKS